MTDPTGTTRRRAVPAAERRAGSRTPRRPRPPTRPGASLPRPFTASTSRREEREIKDGILRMGSIVAERDRWPPSTRSSSTTRRRRSAVIRGDDDLNDAAARASPRSSRGPSPRQQPVARDLRFLLTLDHVAYDLERMGDHAASVAKQARKLAPQRAARATRRICPRWVASWRSRCATCWPPSWTSTRSRAREVAQRDDEMDDLYHRIFDETLDLMRADPANVDPGARILFAAHYLERIGDRVTNIAEDVVFLATGEVEDLNP